MPKNNRILQSQQVLNALITIVRPYLPLDLQNTRITAEDIIAVLGYASANRISPDAACHELKDAPSVNRLREVLAKALPDRITLQGALNRILRGQTPRFVKKGKRSYYIAIDLTLIQRASLEVNDQFIINCASSEIEDGVHGMEALLKSEPRPTAVFCFNDLMAIGALSVLNANKLKVPQEISIAGFDNIPYSAYTCPPLTAFDQPKRMIGAEAAQMLLGIIDNPDSLQNTVPVTHMMRGHLLVRSSTSEPQKRSS